MRGLVGLLTAQTVSLVGSRMSMLALPWFALETTDSAARTGLVAFAEMLPYVLACAAGGPVQDRIGARRTSIAADLASAAAVAAVPLLYAADGLSFTGLVGLVGLVGLLRGFGDNAKQVIFPQTVAASGVSLTRATSVNDGISRLASLLGAPLAGVLIAAFDAPAVLLLDAASFAVAGVLVPLLVPAVPAQEKSEPYLRSLRAGFEFIRREPLLLGLMLMVLATNLFDSAHGSVLAPVWARDVAGSVVALGLLSGAFGLGAVLGNLVFTAVAPKIPRFAVFAVGFLIGGAPRYVALAVVDQTFIVYAVGFVAGAAMGGVNPILGVVFYERVPEPLRARVLGLARALAWAGIPLGGLLGGWAVEQLGLTAALLAFGALYFAVTLVPFTRPTWRQMDRQSPGTVQQPVHDDSDPVDVARG